MIIRAVGEGATNTARSLSHSLVHLIYAMLICWIGDTANYVASRNHLDVLLVSSILVLVVCGGAQVLVEYNLTVGLVRKFL